MNKNSGPDFALYIFFVMALLIAIFTLPAMVIMIISPLVLFFIIASSGTSDRDSYFKAKSELKWVSLFIAAGTIMLYLFFEFIVGLNGDGFYLLMSFVMFAVALWFTTLYKKIYPIRFLEDFDGFVQERMYDEIEGDLDASFRHRVLKSMKLPNKSKLYPTLVSTAEINHIAYDEVTRTMPLGVQKNIYDVFNDAFRDGFKETKMIKRLHGHSLNRLKGEVKNLEEFEAYLKDFSYFYYMVFRIIKNELNSVNKELNYEAIKKQHKGVIELMLIAMLFCAKYYANVPTGNIAGAFFKKDKHNYVAQLSQYYKDKKMYTQNYAFYAVLCSLPPDLKDVSAKTVAAAGVAIYFAFYKLNEDFLNQNTEEEVMKKWLKI